MTTSAHRACSPENATMPPASDATPKRPETPSKCSNADEPSVAATPGRSAGKARQAINVKAELEKRQGGKTLLNLVVIGGMQIHQCTELLTTTNIKHNGT